MDAPSARYINAPLKSVKHFTALEPFRSFVGIGGSFTQKSGALGQPSLFHVVLRQPFVSFPPRPSSHVQKPGDASGGAATLLPPQEKRSSRALQSPAHQYFRFRALRVCFSAGVFLSDLVVSIEFGPVGSAGSAGSAGRSSSSCGGSKRSSSAALSQSCSLAGGLERFGFESWNFFNFRAAFLKFDA